MYSFVTDGISNVLSHVHHRTPFVLVARGVECMYSYLDRTDDLNVVGLSVSMRIIRLHSSWVPRSPTREAMMYRNFSEDTSSGTYVWEETVLSLLMYSS